MDLLVSWLDDSDPIRRADLKKHSGNDNFDEKANNDARFRDYELFHFCFHAIKKVFFSIK